MRILIATDAWRPQVNGVVSTLERMTEAAAEFGAQFDFLTPQGMWTTPLPTYPDIRVAIPTPGRIRRRIEDAASDHIHIVTEGPIGWLTRGSCLKSKRQFTTSYHTRFPEYIRARTGIPELLTYAGLRHFHAPSATVMAPTPTIVADLTRRGFRKVRLWTRGVNHALFRPRANRVLDLPRPIFLSVGRVAVEKNLEALLDLDLPGSTVIVGDGPARLALARRYPRCAFPGRTIWRSARRALFQRRRVRFPLPDRHLRHCADRGDGERTAGCGLSRSRPNRCCRAGGGNPRRRPARGLFQSADDSAGGGAGLFASVHLERKCATVPRECRDLALAARAFRFEAIRAGRPRLRPVANGAPMPWRGKKTGVRERSLLPVSLDGERD